MSRAPIGNPWVERKFRISLERRHRPSLELGMSECGPKRSSALFHVLSKEKREIPRGPLDQERVSDAASSMSRGDETKLDPNTLSLISAACAQVQARSVRLRFSLSL